MKRMTSAVKPEHAKSSRNRFGLMVMCSLALLLVGGLVFGVSPQLRFHARYAWSVLEARAGWKNVDLSRAEGAWRERLGEAAALPFAEARIEIRKAERSLTLYDGEARRGEYRIGLGPVPAGHKQLQGDGRTPEGDYRICDRRLNTKDHLFMGLNYPRPEDAEAALGEGWVSETEAERVRAADGHEGLPPWDTSLGGAIGIHGNGAGDWTAGCIALSDANAEEVWVATGLWTPVSIRP